MSEINEQEQINDLLEERIKLNNTISQQGSEILNILEKEKNLRDNNDNIINNSEKIEDKLNKVIKNRQSALESLKKYYNSIRDISNDTSISETKLSKLSKDLLVSLDKENKIYNNNYSAAESLYETEKNINISLKERKSVMESFEEYYNSLEETATSILDASGLQIFNFKSLFGEIVKINSQLTKMSATLGTVNGNGFEQVKNAFTEATKGIGETFEEARNTVDSLINKGYVGNFAEATKAISLFGKATDISRSELADTFDLLNKAMKMSEGGVASIYASMQKISQTYGLTKDGMTKVNAAIKPMTVNMKSFGSSEVQVKNMAVGMTKLASEMEKVGLSADKAASLVERLTDIDKLEDNIGLYAQLGISLSDALSGNFDPSQMQAGLIDFGNKVKEMGPIAGNAYAKAFGMSYKDAVMQADMKQITEDALTPEAKAMKSLENALDKTQDGFNQLQTAINKLKGLFSSLGPALIGVIAFVRPKIVSFIKETIDSIKEMFKTVDNGAKTTAEKTKNLTRRQKLKDHNKAFKELVGEHNSINWKKNNGEIDSLKALQSFKSKETYESMGYKGSAAKTGAWGAINRVRQDGLEAIGNKWNKTKNSFNTNIALNGGGKKGIGKTILKGGVKGAGKILGGIGKMLGPIGIVLSIIAPILQKNEKLMRKINEIMSIAEKELTPLIDTLVEALTPLLDVLIDALSPILKLAITLLKPLIKATMWLLTPIMWLIKGIGKLASIFSSNEEATVENTEQLKENSLDNKEHLYIRPSGRVAATSANIINDSGTITKEETPVNSTVEKTSTTEKESKEDNKKLNKNLNKNISSLKEAIDTLNINFTKYYESVINNGSLFSNDSVSGRNFKQTLDAVMENIVIPMNKMARTTEDINRNTNRSEGPGGLLG